VRRARAEQRVLGPFVGRAQELGILRELVTKAERGTGQVAGIVGEPGSGKSRLLYELRQSLRGRRVVYVEGHCLAYAGLTPYFPLVALMRDFCRVTAADSGETVAARLRRRLRGLAMAPEIEMPLLLQMMGLSAMTDTPGLDPETLKARVFGTLREILLNLSRRRPIVLAIENVHWIDPTSEAFFDSLTEHLGTTPLLLLMTYRPGYRPSWLARSWANQIALHPLGAPDSQRIVRGVMGAVPLAADLETEILATAEGNPFFLEELARSLLDRADRPGGVRVPNTIHAVIEARIDRLAPEDKRLLQTAAVIGREVPLTWLQPVVGLTDEALRDGIARLQAAEFLFETRAAPDRVYAFRHALIQAVAYATLVPAQRRSLHGSVLDCVTRVADDRRADHLGQLAQHAARAEAWDRAAVYFHRAAEAAWARSAHREAAQLWAQASEALRHLPEERRVLELEADVRFGLAHALYSGGELARGLEEYGHAEATAAQLGDPRRLAQVTAGLAYVHGSRGDHAGAIAAGERAMASALALGDLPLQVWTGVGLGREYFAQGEYRRGIERTRLAVEALRNTPVDRRFQAGSLLPAVGARTWLALCHGRRGEFGPALTVGREAVQIADDVGAPLEQVWAYFTLGRIHLGRGEFEVGERYLSRALPLCEGRRFPLYLPRVLSSLGVARVHRGQPAEGLAMLERAVDEARAIGLLYGYSMILTHIGDAHLEVGRLAEARRPAEEALQIARAHGERGDEAWILHLVGGIDAAERAGPVEHAAAGLLLALARAEALEMRPLAARCQLELGALYRVAGRPEAARRWLERAIALLREMEMTFWLATAERELAALR
jgi:tetratricopeptide (TPR) repeat protein